ncbi:phage tail protein [Fulvivirga sp. 29W222]|uniref:Phage tail protein n=1 Tax=Fulvivirga marina TaxID=2494733 RepID=A0A937FWC1_9BACT|nr:phage tail protein [Fulvivirga marina]MBL6445827.1 phage tail protein [Fulvivirga marina]
MADNPLSNLLDQRPVTGLHFRVSLADMAGAASMLAGGVAGTKFSKVSGLKVYASINEESISKSDGPETFIEDIRYDDIILERGLTSDPTPFMLWCMQVFSEFARSKGATSGAAATGSLAGNMKGWSGMTSVVKNLVITLMNEKSIPLIAWGIKDAVPISWDVSPLDAMTNSYVTETIKLRHKGFEILPIPGADMI